MSQEHHIETLMDVFKKVPKDRIRLCMRELADGLIHAREFQEMHDDEGIEHCVFPGYFRWIDDDEGTYELNITNNGEKLADVKLYNQGERNQ